MKNKLSAHLPVHCQSSLSKPRFTIVSIWGKSTDALAREVPESLYRKVPCISEWYCVVANMNFFQPLLDQMGYTVFSYLVYFYERLNQCGCLCTFTFSMGIKSVVTNDALLLSCSLL